MENNNRMTALFSGRFDPPHLGHLISILRLSNKFDKVIVVILDYRERAFPVEYARTVLCEALSFCCGEFQVYTNSKHFAQITRKELKEWGFDVYCAGNMEVLNHIKGLGVPVQYVERAYEYEANNDRFAKEVKSIIKSLSSRY